MTTHVLDVEVVGSPPVAAVKTRSATGGRSATVCWSTWVPATHTVSRVPLTVTTTWVVAPCRVGIDELVATQFGDAAGRAAVGDADEVGRRVGSLFEVGESDRHPADPRVAERTAALSEEGRRVGVGEGEGHPVRPGAPADHRVEGDGQPVGRDRHRRDRRAGLEGRARVGEIESRAGHLCVAVKCPIGEGHVAGGRCRFR